MPSLYTSRYAQAAQLLSNCWCDWGKPTGRSVGSNRPPMPVAEAVLVRPNSSALRYQLAELYDLGERTKMAIEQCRTSGPGIRHKPGVI